MPAVGGFLFCFLFCLVCYRYVGNSNADSEICFSFLFLKKKNCYCIIPRSKRKKGQIFGWYINYASAVHFKNGLILRASWFRFRFRFRLVRWVDGFGGAPGGGVKGGKRLVGRLVW